MEQKCDFAWIRFLNNQAVVRVANKQDFRTFRDFLMRHGIVSVLGKDLEYEDWVHLAIINHCNPSLFFFEYDNARGLSWTDNRQQAEYWYGGILLPEDLTK